MRADPAELLQRLGPPAPYHQDVREQIAHLDGHGSPGAKEADSEIARSAAASIRSTCTEVDRVSQGPSVSIANAARNGSACTRELGTESSAARSAKSKHSRCEPYQAADRYWRAATWQP